MSIEGNNPNLSSSFQSTNEIFGKTNEEQIKKSSPKARKAFLKAGKAMNAALAKFQKNPDSAENQIDLVVANTHLRNAASKLRTSQKKSGILAKIGRLFGYVVGMGASQSETHMGLNALKHVLIRDLTPKKNS